MTYEQMVKNFEMMSVDARIDLMNELAAMTEEGPFEIHRTEDFDEFMSYLTDEELREKFAHSHYNPLAEVYWLDPVMGSDDIHSSSVDECEWIKPTFLAKYCVDKEVDVEQILREWGW